MCISVRTKVKHPSCYYGVCSDSIRLSGRHGDKERMVVNYSSKKSSGDVRYSDTLSKVPPVTLYGNLQKQSSLYVYIKNVRSNWFYLTW